MAEGELLEEGTNSALWAILDQVVDGYAPVVAELERDIEQVEATVFSGAVAIKFVNRFGGYNN